MKPIISKMVEHYETGKLSRRDLIQGLAMLVAAGESGAAAAKDAGLKATGIDHVSVRVSDMERSATFYQSLFNLVPLGGDKEHNILRLGSERVMVSLRQDKPHGMIDHFGVKVENFKKEPVTELLKQRGLSPEENWEYGYFVRDPDGVYVQML